jgi:CheY-like chemotaxis protein
MQHTKSKIILVEDNPADVELTKIAYTGLLSDFELLHFYNGEQLINSLPGIDLADISYILLDLNMPRLNGIEVLRIFSEHKDWHKIPVIVFTSSHHFGDISICYYLGSNAYVAKPVDIDVFERTIRIIHEFWGKANRRPTYKLPPDTSLLPHSNFPVA